MRRAIALGGWWNDPGRRGRRTVHRPRRCSPMGTSRGTKSRSGCRAGTGGVVWRCRIRFRSRLHRLRDAAGTSPTWHRELDLRDDGKEATEVLLPRCRVRARWLATPARLAASASTDSRWRTGSDEEVGRRGPRSACWSCHATTPRQRGAGWSRRWRGSSRSVWISQRRR
jgi:hypothetical protein